jgi:hypothetical protein
VAEAKAVDHRQSVSKEIRFKSLGAESLIPPTVIFNIIDYDRSTYYLHHKNL